MSLAQFLHIQHTHYSILVWQGNMTKLTALSSEIPLYVSIKVQDSCHLKHRNRMLNKFYPLWKYTKDTDPTNLFIKYITFLPHKIGTTNTNPNTHKITYNNISLKFAVWTHYTLARVNGPISYTWNYCMHTQC
jgi:hypothetical protein